MEIIRGVLGFFGYCKIPKETVQLSLKIEMDLGWLHRMMTTGGNKEFIGEMVKAQKTLTRFLSSGRMLQ